MSRPKRQPPTRVTAPWTTVTCLSGDWREGWWRVECFDCTDYDPDPGQRDPEWWVDVDRWPDAWAVERDHRAWHARWDTPPPTPASLAAPLTNPWGLPALLPGADEVAHRKVIPAARPGMLAVLAATLRGIPA